MKTIQAVQHFLDYHRTNSKKKYAIVITVMPLAIFRSNLVTER